MRNLPRLTRSAPLTSKIFSDNFQCQIPRTQKINKISIKTVFMESWRRLANGTNGEEIYAESGIFYSPSRSFQHAPSPGKQVETLPGAGVELIWINTTLGLIYLRDGEVVEQCAWPEDELSWNLSCIKKTQILSQHHPFSFPFPFFASPSSRASATETLTRHEGKVRVL